mgnify:FL=1
MIAKVKNFEVHCEPMTKFEYYDKIKKMQIQHFENKRINGFYCNWNGYKFWIDEINFNKLYTIEE